MKGHHGLQSSSTTWKLFIIICFLCSCLGSCTYRLWFYPINILLIKCLLWKIPSDSLLPIYIVWCLSQTVFVLQNHFDHDHLKTTKSPLDCLWIEHNLPSRLYISLWISSNLSKMKGHDCVLSFSKICWICIIILCSSFIFRFLAQIHYDFIPSTSP